MRSISVPIPSLFGILPRLVDDTHNCLKELFRIHSMIIHSYSQSKLFCFHGIGKLDTKYGNSHQRDTMVRRLVQTVVSHMGDKNLDVLVSQ